MKKTTRNILIMLAVLVVLGGAVAALLLSQPQETDENSSQGTASTAKETLTEREPADVASVSVSNAEGSFEIAEAGTDEDGEAAFTLKGCEKYPLKADSLASSVKCLTTLSATKSLGEQEGLAGFGLAGAEAVSVTVQYKDGTSDELVLGRKGGESSGRYVLKDGQVYIASGIEELLYGSMYAYFDPELYTIADLMEETTDDEGNTTESATADELRVAVFSGTAFPQEVRVEHVTNMISSYLITEPVRAEAGTTKFADMLTALKTMTATEVVAAGLTDQVLEEYGLKEPEVRVEYTLNNEDHIVAVSAVDSEGNRFLTADDRDMVYKVTNESVATWAEISLMEMRMSYVYLPDIKAVETLKMTVNGTGYTFNAQRTRNEEKSTEKSPYYDLTLQNADGKEIEYTNYQALYQQIIAISVLNMNQTDYSGEPVFRLEYDYFDQEKQTDVVEYYAVSSDRYAAVLNGQLNGLVRKSDVDKVIEQIPALNNGETIEKKN